MSEKALKRQLEKGRDAKTASNNLLQNKNDEIEGTFCYELFELGIFNEPLFLELLLDMEFLVAQKGLDTSQQKTINWIILCALRCFTSHFNIKDLYKIKNLNDALYSKWSNDYFERLKNILFQNYD